MITLSTQPRMRFLADHTADHTYNMLFFGAANTVRCTAFSAGHQPHSKRHPFVVDVRTGHPHDPALSRTGRWEASVGLHALRMIFIYMVRDHAARETERVWPWGMRDPLESGGTEAERRMAFSEAYRMLRNWIAAFVKLPSAGLDQVARAAQMDSIGCTDGTSLIKALRAQKEIIHV